MLAKLSRPRILLQVFSLIVSSTVVYFTVFELISWHQQNLLIQRTYERRKVCFGEESMLIAAINRHLQDEHNRTKYRNGREGTTAEPEKVNFQRITDEPEKLYLYSAYFDRETQSVKIVGGAANGKSSLSIFCQYYDQEEQFLTNHAGYIETVEYALSEYPYAGSFVVCPILPTDCIIPTYISVSVNMPNLGFPENLFHISYQAIKTPELEFALCVQPVFDYDKPLEFLEWIEFYKLMGVQSFTFYNETIGPKTSCLMRTYAEVVVLNWSPVFTPYVDIPVHSQGTQTNECVLRYRGRSKFLLNVDFDEMIMPSIAANYTEMFEQILEGAGAPPEAQISAFVFRNGFFLKNEFLKETELNVNVSNNSTQLEGAMKRKLVISKFIREEELWKPYKRSKCIVQPNLVRKAGVHYLLESKPGTFMHTVLPEIGYLHHYRETKNKHRVFSKSDVVVGSGRLIEKSADRFRDLLARIVLQKLKQHSQLCDLDIDNLLK